MNDYVDSLANITADEAKEIFEDLIADYWIEESKNIF